MQLQTVITNNGQYKGSVSNAKKVAQEIEKRYGKKESKKYDPLSNCFTYHKWQELGYQVKKGEKAIRITTFIQKAVEDSNTKESVVISSYPKHINVFYILQVEKIKQ